MATKSDRVAGAKHADHSSQSAHRRGGAAQVAPVYLRPLREEALRRGADVAALFQGAGLSAGDLDQPGLTVSHHQAVTVVRRALRLFDNPNLGLELGMRSRVTDRGALALGLLSSPDAAAALSLSLHYPASAGFLLNVRESRSPTQHVLVAESIFESHDLADFLVDKLFSGLVRQRRQISATEGSPVLVELMRAPPANLMAHEQHYRSPVRFNSLRNRLVFDDSAAGVALPMANAMSYRLSRHWLDREAALSVGTSALGMAVQRAIRHALPQVLTPALLASLLHVSERSLRRKLALEGLSFRALLDDVRRARALELLSNGRRSLTDAAAHAGFGDARSFRRAVQRWTGQPPSALRAVVNRRDGVDDAES